MRGTKMSANRPQRTEGHAGALLSVVNLKVHAHLAAFIPRHRKDTDP